MINGKKIYKKNMIDDDKWIGGFRVNPLTENFRSKRESSLKKSNVRQSSDYKLLTPDSGMSPIGSVAKMLMKAVLESKNKTKTEP